MTWPYLVPYLPVIPTFLVRLAILTVASATTSKSGNVNWESLPVRPSLPVSNIFKQDKLA